MALYELIEKEFRRSPLSTIFAGLGTCVIIVSSIINTRINMAGGLPSHNYLKPFVLFVGVVVLSASLLSITLRGRAR